VETSWRGDREMLRAGHTLKIARAVGLGKSGGQAEADALDSDTTHRGGVAPDKQSLGKDPTHRHRRAPLLGGFSVENSVQCLWI
jgi:hypothetical protein